MIGVAVAGIVTVLLALLFRQQKPEFAMMLSLACCLFIFFVCWQRSGMSWITYRVWQT